MSDNLPANEQPRRLDLARREDFAWTLGWSAASLLGAGGFAALMSAGVLPISAPWWPWLLMAPSGVVLAQASLRYERNGRRVDAPVLALTWGGSMILLLGLALLIPLSWALVGPILVGSCGLLWLLTRGKTHPNTSSTIFVRLNNRYRLVRPCNPVGLLHSLSWRKGQLSLRNYLYPSSQRVINACIDD